MSKRTRQYISILAALAAYYLVHEWAARCLFGVLLLVNGLVFWKRVLPVYRQSFSQQ